VFEQAKMALPGSRRQDPTTLTQSGSELSKDQGVFVHCVHSHEVSRSTAMRMCAMGAKAKYLSGGTVGTHAGDMIGEIALAI
jgi:Fe-Mn family superoxide dismutase